MKFTILPVLAGVGCWLEPFSGEGYLSVVFLTNIPSMCHSISNLVPKSSNDDFRYRR